MSLSRRDFLLRSGLVGCSLAASPLVTPVSFAAAPWENRLVVIILRGGMDGLDVVQPYGDPSYAALRQTLRGGPENGATDLDGFYALHPAMAPLMPLWQAGELAFVQAVSTPYRDKRSHFDGQDLLEAGTPDLGAGVRDGWLNRMMQGLPGLTSETAYAIGTSELQVLTGAAPVANWTPETTLDISPQAEGLLELMYDQDPAFRAAFEEARMLSDTGDAAMGRRPSGHKAIAEFAAERLSQAARIAAFSINGWDTHKKQARSLKNALTQLQETILTMKAAMPGPVWQKTTIVAMTEFGRTARENGTKGTDHGTGGLMCLAGGAVRGGRVYGDWPGLGDADLYAGRDLMPTRDVRAHTAWVMRGQFGIDRATLEARVFPGLEMGDDPGLLL